MIMWYHLTVGVQGEVQREQQTVETVFVRVSIPSSEGGVAHCDTNHGTLTIVFTSRMDDWF